MLAQHSYARLCLDRGQNRVGSISRPVVVAVYGLRMWVGKKSVCGVEEIEKVPRGIATAYDYVKPAL